MIPKIIHQIWTQGIDKVPAKYHSYINGWKSLDKYGYTYKCWDDDSIKEIISLFDISLIEIYNYFNLPQQRSDLGRYIIIYLFGGFYVDIDIEPTGKSLNSLLDYNFIISKNEYYIRQSFFGSVSKNELLFEAINHIKNNYRRKFYEIFDVLFVERTTGGIISSLINNKYHKENKVNYIEKEKVYICESIDDCQIDKNEKELIAIIHFEKSWNILKYIHRFILFYKYIIFLTSIFLLSIIFSSCKNDLINYLCLLKNVIKIMIILTLFYITLYLIVYGNFSRDGLFYLVLLLTCYLSLSKKCDKCNII
jgi:mannosyltransferase OCH1-like enzyme